MTHVLGLSAGTTALVSTGANVVVPGSGPIVAVGIGVLNSLFGNDRDAKRLAREQWFEQGGKQGSPTAARVLIGGTQNTGSNEIPFYQAGIKRLLADPLSAPTMQRALSIGPYWDTTDDAESSNMRALVENELLSLTSTPPSGPSSTSGGAGGGAHTLPAMTTTAPYNWLPWILGGAGVVAAAVVLPRISRRGRRA
jgi:hypothetical protein